MTAFAPSISATHTPPSRLLMWLEAARAAPEYAAMVAAMPLLRMAPQGDGHGVLVLPGLLASDASTLALRDYLQRQGYDAHGWGLGRNKGFRPHLETQIIAKMRRMAEQSGRKISLIGWSLGGIYARQLAKDRPDLVRQVVTLGSPFGGPPKATNAWRIYELASRTRVDDSHVFHFAQNLAEPPPMPTTAIFSRTDGVCPWRNCMEQDAEYAENIEVYGSHCGLGHHPAAMFAIADRLAQPEGQWRKFSPGPLPSLAFPNPYRNVARL